MARSKLRGNPLQRGATVTRGHDMTWPSDWCRPSPEAIARLADIEMLLLDVDGVLTDGTVLRGADGSEARRFSVIDGHGIGMLRDDGMILGVVSREPSEITRGRMEKLRMAEIHVGASDKAVVVADIRTRHNLGAGAIAFMGDDLPDLAAFAEADLCIAPSNAHPAVKAAADVVLCRRGGHEAVRELAEIIRAAKGLGPMAHLLV
jgi:3-deoxy-D-manno-octulosonate 8-phosphate phosphatase (KDO 8-P phosphatase)